MVCWSGDRLLVAVDLVIVEESLDLLQNVRNPTGRRRESDGLPFPPSREV